MAVNIWIAALAKRKREEFSVTKETQTACQFYSTEIHLQRKEKHYEKNKSKKMSKAFPAEIESACHVFPTEIQSNVTGKVRWFF